MTILRSLIFQTLLYAWIIVIGILCLPLLILPRGAVVWSARLWCRGVMGLLAGTVGLTYQVRGRELIPEAPAVFASKHQSAWDTLAAVILVPDAAIVIKKELQPIPLFGWYLRKHGMIGVDREAGPRALKRMVADARAVLDAGRPVLIYPEGTRTAPGERRPYLPGVAALYLHLGVPVVPVALNSGVLWARRSFVKHPGRVDVEFLAPILPGLDRKRFLAELEERIETATAALVAGALVGKSVGNLAASPHRSV